MPTSDRTTPESIMLAFNDAINARGDLDRLGAA
jgi:hypothetical protein